MNLALRLAYGATGQLARAAAALVPSGDAKWQRSLTARRDVRRRYAAWARHRDPSRAVLWLPAAAGGGGLQARVGVGGVWRRGRGVGVAGRGGGRGGVSVGGGGGSGRGPFPRFVVMSATGGGRAPGSGCWPGAGPRRAPGR
jgi:hypothetical protein